LVIIQLNSRQLTRTQSEVHTYTILIGISR